MPESAPAAAGGVRRRVVIFDLDGVLVDSFGVMRQAFTTAYAEVVGAGEPPFEEYERHLGRYFPDIMRIMNLPLEMEEPFVRESYRLAREVTLFDGVGEMLRTLRARGYGLAVATGKAGPRARHLLGELDVLPLFDHVIGSDEIARPKPAPDIVLRALDLLGAGPEEAMMIGDAVADLDSARGAGVLAVAALWGETDGVELIAAEPDAVLHRPAELLALLGELEPNPEPGIPGQLVAGPAGVPTAHATRVVMPPTPVTVTPVAQGLLAAD
ncbi:HAD-IA family hydrolase [Frankia sp. AgB32]|uniref:HAD-IA family hydrolase n=1 Tax=Frankia sp. AgB32 TaxID=631119 RepID=UPI0027E36129|nr:HAD-IA family hydrolase [Frankia sp. AgB32]